MMEYKDKRKAVDDLKDSLQKLITEYSKLTESGKRFKKLNETKKILLSISCSDESFASV